MLGSGLRFNRLSGKEGINDIELKEIVKQLEARQADADLGGWIYKVRLARPGEEKSGGYQVVVYFRNNFRTFFFMVIPSLTGTI